MGRLSVDVKTAGLLIPSVVILLVWPISTVAEVLLDPMRPEHYLPSASVEKSGRQVVDTTSWSLTAVLSAADRTVAVINGKSLQKGDVLEGYTVMDIQPDHALLHSGEKQLLLPRVGTGLKKNIR